LGMWPYNKDTAAKMAAVRMVVIAVARRLVMKIMLSQVGSKIWWRAIGRRPNHSPQMIIAELPIYRKVIWLAGIGK
jgi:hypothetical protein